MGWRGCCMGVGDGRAPGERWVESAPVRDPVTPSSRETKPSGAPGGSEAGERGETVVACARSPFGWAVPKDLG